MMFHIAKAKVEQSKWFRCFAKPNYIQGGQVVLASAGIVLMSATVLVPISGAVEATPNLHRHPPNSQIKDATTINRVGKAFGVHTVKSPAQVAAGKRALAEFAQRLSQNNLAKVLQALAILKAFEFLACVRGIESNGDYGAVSPGGTWRGAYQFDQPTWNNTAAHSGRYDLIGVSPNQVSPSDQDAMAVALYDWQGTNPWAGDVARCW